MQEINLIGQPGSDEVLLSPDLTDQLNHFLKLQFAIIYSFLDQHLGGQILLLDFLQTNLCEYPKNKSRIYLEICFVFFFFTILAYVSCQVMNLKSCRPISNYFHLGTMDLCGLLFN